MAIGVASLLLLLFLTAIVTGKIIGVEAVAVAQFAFISLMSIKDMPPSFAALKKGLIVCIYIPLENNLELDITAENYVRGMNLSHQMALNFGIDFGLILIPILIGTTLLILSVSCFKNRK